MPAGWSALTRLEGHQGKIKSEQCQAFTLFCPFCCLSLSLVRHSSLTIVNTLQKKRLRFSDCPVHFLAAAIISFIRRYVSVATPLPSRQSGASRSMVEHRHSQFSTRPAQTGPAMVPMT